MLLQVRQQNNQRNWTNCQLKIKMSEQNQASNIVPPHKRTILGHETSLRWFGNKSMTSNQLQHIAQ